MTPNYEKKLTWIARRGTSRLPSLPWPVRLTYCGVLSLCSSYGAAFMTLSEAVDG